MVFGDDRTPLWGERYVMEGRQPDIRNQGPRFPIGSRRTLLRYLAPFGFHPLEVPMYKAIRDHSENAKSINFWGKSFFVDISSRVDPMTMALGSLLDVVVL